MSIKTITKTWLSSCLCAVAMCSGAALANTEDWSATLQHLAQSDQRSLENRARNKYRNPVQTLQFFGLQPTMSVLEVWPGHGWYTEILAPFLKQHGQLTLAQFRQNDGSLKDDRSIFWARVSQRLEQRIADHSDYFGHLTFVELDPPAIYPAMSEQFDMVLSFRNAHIWNEEGHLANTLKTLFAALKPGGVLGMVEHRAGRLSDIASSAVEGYLDESYVIAAAELAGFELVASSEVNANPADTKNYPKGVYALPPTLAMGQQNKNIYMAIGESDRMTLKFIKPAL